MFHKINSVAAGEDYTLIVHFWDGATKVYDVKPLFQKWEVFNELRKDGAFNEVKVDEGGYGVSWNDDIDLSCEELWENGETVATPFDEILSFRDASEMWGMDESTLRKAVARGKLVRGVDVCKYGKQWVISMDAMRREYGK